MDSKKIGIGILGLIVLIIVGIFLFGGNKKVYKVTFVNGDLSEVVEVKKNDTVTRPADPTKTGYVFKGWYNGTTEFDFTSKITEDITLTAKWEKIDDKVDDSDKNEEIKVKSYTVQFETDGGSVISKQIVKEGKLATRPEDPTKAEYTFIGWYIGDVEFDFTTKITEDITLTAKWEKDVVISYNIKATESKVGQVIVFVLKDDIKVDGIVDITLINGTTIANVEIPNDGYVTNGYRIEAISNVRVK